MGVMLPYFFRKELKRLQKFCDMPPTMSCSRYFSYDGWIAPRNFSHSVSFILEAFSLVPGLRPSRAGKSGVGPSRTRGTDLK